MTLHPNLRSVAITVVVVALAVAGACGGSSTALAASTVVVQLTDAPFAIDSVQRVDVFVVRVEAREADADSATASADAGDDTGSMGGWTMLATPDQSINLLAYQNGETLTLGQASVPEGSYLGFRLVIDPSRSSITLKNGLVLTGTTDPNVPFPSGDRSGLKIVVAQAVVSADTTTLLVDFDVANSFVLRGNSLTLNGLLFKPVIRAAVRESPRSSIE